MKKTQSLILMGLLVVGALFTSCESENEIDLIDDALVSERQSIIIDNVVYYYSVEKDTKTGEEFLVEDETTKFIQDFFKQNEDYSTFVELSTGVVKYYSNHKTMTSYELKDPVVQQSNGNLNNRNIDDDLILYKDVNFSGTQLCVHPEQSSFVSLGFNDELSSFVLDGGPSFTVGGTLPFSRNVPVFTIWEDTNFGGRSLTFRDYTHFYAGHPAQMRVPNLNMRMGGFLSPRWNDQVSSTEISFDTCSYSTPGAPPACPSLVLITSAPPSTSCSSGGSGSGGSGGGGSGGGGGGGGSGPGNQIVE